MRPPYFSKCNRPDEGSSDEIDELRNSLGELSDQLDAFGLQIEELSTNMESENEKITEDIGRLEEFDQMVTSNLADLAEEIQNLDQYTKLEIELVQQNVTIIGEIINGQGQVIEQNTNDIVELQESISAVDNYNDRIELNSNSIKSLNLSFEGLHDAIGEYDEQIESLQTNLTEANSKIDEVDEHQKELRNDFEYLKYDFRSFTNEISKWQIDIDERLSETEDQIQGTGILCCKK